MHSLSSHVLDTTAGKPVANLTITLYTPDGDTIEGITDNDGRCKNWGDTRFHPGEYRLRFHCADYLLRTHGDTFYPFVDISFILGKDTSHYHVPLLISPFGFSSYRGS